MAKKRKFLVGGVVKIWSDIPVYAENLAEALLLTNDLTATNFATGKGSVNEITFKVVQIYDPEFNVDM